MELSYNMHGVRGERKRAGKKRGKTDKTNPINFFVDRNVQQY